MADIPCFQRLFAVGDRKTDLNRDGRVDIQDVSKFFSVLSKGK